MNMRWSLAPQNSQEVPVVAVPAVAALQWRMPGRWLASQLLCAAANRRPCLKMEGGDWHQVFWPPRVLCGM